jgi:hypothetical protein
MFNFMRFNLGKFNLDFVDDALRGTARLNLSATATMNVVRGFTGYAPVTLITIGNINAASTFEGNVNILMGATGVINAYFYLYGELDLLLGVQSEGFNTFHYAIIHLPDLVMPLNGLLFIDTDNMTITLNGQNVMRYLSRDSEFFMFSPTINEVTFESGNQDNRADIRILWKDAWL